LKTVNLSYLCNRLIDFDEIWQGDANSPLTADRLLKCRIFENPKWRQPPSSNISKVAISPQRFDRHIEKTLNRHISATV